MTFPPSLLKFDPRDLNKKADTLLWPKSPTCTAPFSFPLLENLSRPHQASNRDMLAEVEDQLLSGSYHHAQEAVKFIRARSVGYAATPLTMPICSSSLVEHSPL